MIHKAAAFAAKVHENVNRKGSNVPYIVHPKEVAAIVAAMTDDPEAIAAAYLHDVIEDAGVSYEELKDLFSQRVADMVLAESEDKTKGWEERKQHTIDRLHVASREDKIIAFGDKLSNLRCTASDYIAFGDDLWQKFNQRDKQRHAWYYRSVYETFGDFEEYPFYAEYRLLLKMVFGD